MNTIEQMKKIIVVLNKVRTGAAFFVLDVGMDLSALEWLIDYDSRLQDAFVQPTAWIPASQPRIRPLLYGFA